MSNLEQELSNFPTFLTTWLTFFIAAIVTFVIQVRVQGQRPSPLNFLNHCFPFELWKSSSAHMDAKIFLIRKLTNRLLRGISLILVVLVASRVGTLLSRTFPHHVATKSTVLAVAFCSIVMFVVSEFTDYLTHYMQHKVPVLWELHKVHHSAEFLNPLTAQRGHPAAYVFERAANGIVSGIPAGIFVFVYGLTVSDTLLLALCAINVGLVVTLDALKHSHFPVDFGWFDKVLISPHMHQVHHSSLVHHWDRNYGVSLAIFDWMFGTAYRPRKGEEIVYGISGLNKEELAKYNTLYGSYVAPFVQMGNIAVIQRVLRHQQS